MRKNCDWVRPRYHGWRGCHGARKVECWRRCAGQWFSDGARTLRQIESEMVRKSRDWVRPRYCYKTMGGMQWCDLGGPADPCEDIVGDEAIISFLG